MIRKKHRFDAGAFPFAAKGNVRAYSLEYALELVRSLVISIVFVIISVNTQQLNCLHTPIAFLDNLCYNEIVKKATPDPKVMRDSGVLCIRRLIYDPDPARGLFVTPN